MLTLTRIILAVCLQCSGLAGGLWALLAVNGLLAWIVLMLGVGLGALLMPDNLAIGAE